MKVEATLLILVVLDAVSTYLLVQKHPVELEVSPILRQRGGPSTACASSRVDR